MANEQAVRYEATDAVAVGRKTVQKGQTVVLRPSVADDLIKGGAKLRKAKLAPHTVLKNLRHDGKGYAPKSTVLLHAADAAPLIARGTVVPAAPIGAPEAN